jgi:hypothetical protein
MLLCVSLRGVLSLLRGMNGMASCCVGAAVALANKMARLGWALMMRQEDFRTASVAG